MLAGRHTNFEMSLCIIVGSSFSSSKQIWRRVVYSKAQTSGAHICWFFRCCSLFLIWLEEATNQKPAACLNERTADIWTPTEERSSESRGMKLEWKKAGGRDAPFLQSLSAASGFWLAMRHWSSGFWAASLTTQVGQETKCRNFLFYTRRLVSSGKEDNFSKKLNFLILS